MTETLAPWDVGRPTPQPNTAVASAPPPQLSDAGPRALLVAGEQWKEAAAETDRFALHLDTLSAQDALNELRARKDDLTYGPQGFMQVKGGDVIKKDRPGGPLLDDYKSRFQAVSDDLAKSLGPRGRMMYNERAAAEMAGFKGDIAKHSIQQTEFFNVAVDKDTQQQALAQAARFADDPAKLAEQAERAKGSAERLAISQGRPPAGAGVAAQSNVLRVGVETLLGKNENRKALAYYDGVKDKLDGPDRVALETRMKSTAIDIEGDNIVASAFGVSPPASVKQFEPLIQKASTDSGVRPALITAVMSQESGGDVNAVSPAGARGPMQLMPGTAKDLGVTNPHDPTQAIPAGARYLKQQLDKFGGNERLALMAYNWGPGNVENWIKTGGDPEKIPQETREYVQKVQGYSLGVGGAKSDAAAVKLDLMSRTDISAAVKANAFAKIEKTSSAVEAFRVASTKTLDDQAQSTFAAALVNPEVLKGDTFKGFADQYAALGDRAKATRYGMLASMEGTLKQGLQSATDAQLSILKELAEGLPRQVIEGYMSGNAKARAESASLGSEKFALLKKSIEADNVKPAGLVAAAKEAMNHFANAGKPEEARKVSDYMTAAMNADAVTSGTPAAAAQAIADLTAHANTGASTAAQLQTLDMATTLFSHQQSLLKSDPLKTGASIYAKDVGPLPPLDPTNIPASLAARAETARRIEALSGHKTPLLTNEEATMTRNQLDSATPQQRQAALQSFATAPADAIPGIGAILAGKDDVSDPVSRGYAAALSFYADKDPEVANAILDGVQKRKEMGDALRNMPKSDAFYEAVQTKMGNAFKSLSGKLPAIVVNAAEAIYTSKMIAAGRQGEKALDDTIFNQALDAVIGKPITRAGQMLVPPKGVGDYQFDNAVRSLSDGDVDGFKTLNGSPVTAEKIVRYGLLSNAGRDGQYYVEIPDPARGGQPAYVQRPDGRPYVLDIKPLLERAQRFPGYAMETPNSARDARRRAPASPTEGVQP